MKEKRTDAALSSENTRVTGAVYRKKADAPLFYDARAIAADLLGQIGVSGVRLLPADKDLPPYAHPGRSLEILIGKDRAGLVFELHPGAREAFDIRGSAALFDLDLDALLAAKKTGRAFTELPRFPEVPFELSVLADRFTYAADIIETIRRSSRELVRGADVVSVYEGDPVPAGKKSFPSAWSSPPPTARLARRRSIRRRKRSSVTWMRGVQAEVGGCCRFLIIQATIMIVAFLYKRLRSPV